MSREIKFKVLDKESKKIVGIFDLDDIGTAYEKGIITNCSDNEIWLQYTGAKDRNGKDIYECDIMVLDKNKPSYYVVRYFENKFILDGLSLFDNSIYFNEREVIGNIFENGDIIK